VGTSNNAYKKIVLTSKKTLNRL